MHHSRSILTGLLAIFVASTAIADDCVRIEANPGNATLTLQHNVFRSTPAPANYCSLERGFSYQLLVDAPNHELRRVALKLGDDGTAHLSGVRWGYVLQSLVLPGWGQASLNHKGRTGLTAMNLLATGWATWSGYKDWEAERDTRDYYTTLANESTSQEQAFQYAVRSEIYARTSDAYQENVFALGAFTGWWYLGNLFETFYISSPPGKKRMDDGSFTLSVPRVSGTRAAVQSLLWPGMGQMYQENYGRAVFFQWGFITTALLTIDRKLLFDLRDIDYNYTVELADIAPTQSQRDQLLELADARWDSRETARRHFYTWAGVTGGLWLLSVVDAIISGGSEQMPGRFSTEMSYHDGTLYSGMKVTLR